MPFLLGGHGVQAHTLSGGLLWSGPVRSPVPDSVTEGHPLVSGSAEPQQNWVKLSVPVPLILSFLGAYPLELSPHALLCRVPFTSHSLSPFKA